MQHFTDVTRKHFTFNLSAIWCNEYLDLIQEGYEPHLSFYCQVEDKAMHSTLAGQDPFAFDRIPF